MRVRVMIDGRPEWVDHGPSQASLRGFGGALISGESGPYDAERKRLAAKHQREREDPARFAARQASWRASKAHRPSRARQTDVAA